MKIKNVVVIGAGAMGSGIAQIAVMAGYNVTLVDIKDEYIAKGIASIGKGEIKRDLCSYFTRERENHYRSCECSKRCRFLS